MANSNQQQQNAQDNDGVPDISPQYIQQMLLFAVSHSRTQNQTCDDSLHVSATAQSIIWHTVHTSVQSATVESKCSKRNDHHDSECERSCQNT